MTLELVAQIFQIVIIPLLGVLTTYLVKYISAKISEVSSKTDNELEQKYLAMLNETITNCVIATTQTYVQSLKAQGAFDEEAQKKAFAMTYSAVMDILSKDLVDYLTNAVGDLDLYIRQKIESTVNSEKK